MMKIALGVEYNGSGFQGWQRQKEGRFVQSELETALSHVAGMPVHVVCAGRTDAGVHASDQVVHFETSVVRDEGKWLKGANAWLQKDISIQWERRVTADFHARFSAISRTYRYVIYNYPIRPSIDRDRVSWIYHPLDEIRMDAAAQYLLGTHDFSAYRGAGCQSLSTIRTVTSFTLRREGRYIVVNITANAFLYHMVRNIMGVLIRIGRGQQPPDWAKEVLLSKDRSKGAATAPPGGLFLEKVEYPTHYLENKIML